MVDEIAVRELASAFRGELIRPGDDRYESARRIWNGMIDKRPALIVRCANVADVIAGVNFARETGLLVAPGAKSPPPASPASRSAAASAG